MLAPIAALLIPLAMGHEVRVIVKEEILDALIRLVVETRQVTNRVACALKHAASCSIGKHKGDANNPASWLQEEATATCHAQSKLQLWYKRVPVDYR